MSVNGKFDGISVPDLIAEADRSGVRKPLDIIADVRASLESSTEHANSAGLSSVQTAAIARDFHVL